MAFRLSGCRSCGIRPVRGIPPCVPHQWRREWRCHILPEEGSYVDGVLWRISERDEQHLDHYEGFPFLYGKEPVTVTNQDGVRREIMAYTMNSPYKDKPAMPSVSYLEGILNGCRQNGIDTQTVIEAVRCTQQELPQKVVPHKKQRHPKHKEER